MAGVVLGLDASKIPQIPFSRRPFRPLPLPRRSTSPPPRAASREPDPTRLSETETVPDTTLFPEGDGVSARTAWRDSAGANAPLRPRRVVKRRRRRSEGEGERAGG